MFVYRPLKRETSEIRLIRFKECATGRWPIELELKHASPEDCIRYAALSYVWGRADRTTSAEISVNGSSFVICNNLHVALLQLHQNGTRSWLWVDSVCINQSDLEEKSIQVGIMREIFGQADHVYLWLGLGSSETGKAMDFVSLVGIRALAAGVLDLWFNEGLLDEVSNDLNERVASSQNRYNCSGNTTFRNRISEFVWDLLHEPGLLGHETQAGMGHIDGGLTSGIKDLMQREYWHRIWIVQEITLAQNATVLCGEKAVSLDWFDAAISSVSHCIQSFRRLCPESRKFGHSLHFNFYENIALATRRKYQRREKPEAIKLESILLQNSVPPDRPHYSASDPRDICFGLLGVITDGDSLNLRVDYRLSTAEVFTMLTRALIHDSDQALGAYNLDQCVPRIEDDKSIGQLPSWVPDWREIGKRGATVNRINAHGAFNATPGMPPLCPIVSCAEGPSEVLRRLGCRVDTITEVLRPPSWKTRDDGRVTNIVDVKAWLTSIVEFAKLGPASGPGEDYVWRTIMVDKYDGVVRPNKFERIPTNDEMAHVIRKIMRQEVINIETLSQLQREYFHSGPYTPAGIQPTLDQQVAAVAKEWPNVIAAANRGRTVFKTSKSMFGLGHVAIRPGDLVTLLGGVHSPIILRQHNDRSPETFTFVGDAYVDGIMDGEFLLTKPVYNIFEIS